MQRRRTYLRLLGIGAAGAVAGCSSGGDSEPTETGGPTPAGTATERAPGDAERTWEQVTKLPSDDADDAFGWSVALDGDGTTALVGAVDDEDPNGRDGEYLSGAGSVSVYGRSADGWTRQARLAPEDGEAGDNFGFSVALAADGTTAVVGAPGATVSEPRQGAIYLFERIEGEWQETTRLAASDPVVGDRLGGTVALSDDGTTVIANAPLGNPASTDLTGVVYVFTDGESWTQQANLPVPEAVSGAGGIFGYNLALDADGATALVSAPNSDGAGGSGAGVTVVYGADGGNWTDRAILEPADGDLGDRFGSGVALDESGTTAVVGAAEDEDPNGATAGRDDEEIGAGSAYVFTSTGGSWQQVRKLAPDDGDGGDQFGANVAIDEDGTTALVGAYNDEDPNGAGDTPYSGAGSAYTYTSGGGSWTQQAKLAADDGDSRDIFGASIALSGGGGTALIGAPGDEDPHGGSDGMDGIQGGSAYVFE